MTKTKIPAETALPSTGASAAGIAYVSAFLVLANANAVFSGNLLQTVHPLTFLFWSFLASSVFFGTLLVARNGPGALTVERTAIVPLATLNATSAFTWIGYFYALHFIEPAIVSAIMGGLGPLCIIGLDRFLRGRRFSARIYLAAAGVLLGAGLLAWASLTGRSGLAEISRAASVVGLLAATVAGFSQALNTVATKQLADRAWGATRIMTHRFYLLITVAAVLAVSGPGLSVDGTEHAGLVAIATMLGVIAPLWPLQRGIILSEPFMVAALMSLAPVLTFLFQGFDHRMHWSLLSAAGCVLVTLFTVYGARLIHKEKLS